jgi:hypothetical protein
LQCLKDDSKTNDKGLTKTDVNNRGSVAQQIKTTSKANLAIGGDRTGDNRAADKTAMTMAWMTTAGSTKSNTNVASHTPNPIIISVAIGSANSMKILAASKALETYHPIEDIKTSPIRDNKAGTVATRVIINKVCKGNWEEAKPARTTNLNIKDNGGARTTAIKRIREINGGRRREAGKTFSEVGEIKPAPDAATTAT